MLEQKKEPIVEQVIAKDFIERARHFSAATLHEAAGKIGALPSAIKPLDPSMRLYGWAFPVQSPPSDNLWLHRAISAAQPDDVLIVSTGGVNEFGYWGEIMTHAARAKLLAGLVIDGGVRDSQRLVSLAFPIFSHGICIRGTSKNPSSEGSLRDPIHFGEVVVHYGDLVVGDADGVVILPQERVAEILDKAQQREDAEAMALERIAQGETTIEIFHLETYE